jgi:hypothetical protein
LDKLFLVFHTQKASEEMYDAGRTSDMGLDGICEVVDRASGQAVIDLT